MKKILFLTFLLSYTILSFSQCEDGESDVQITINTDNWGYEGYWELYLEGQLCGDTPVFQGGNDLDVGCTGAGEEDALGENGYESNATIIENFCLITGEVYQIFYVDDYIDGGFDFEIEQNGVVTHFFQEVGSGDADFLFTAGDENPAFIDGDRPC